MNLIYGDIWSEIGKADMICFTANSTLDKHDALIMGAGSALECKTRWPHLAREFGSLISDDIYGKRFGFLDARADASTIIGAFQTKYHWREKGDLELIEHSTHVLINHLEAVVMMGYQCRVAMVFPGTGYGGLNRADVLPIIAKLPSNVWVYEKQI